MDYDDFAREQLPGVVRFAAALTADGRLAEDLVQDALVRAHLKWGLVSTTDRPDLYLRRMVLDGYLGGRRWYQQAVHPAADPEAGQEPIAPDPTGRVADRAELATLLTRLPRQQRAAIVLRFLEDRDDAEIAEVLGCAEATVRGHISGGLAALRPRAEAEPHSARPTTEVGPT